MNLMTNRGPTANTTETSTVPQKLIELSSSTDSLVKCMRVKRENIAIQMIITKLEPTMMTHVMTVQ